MENPIEQITQEMREEKERRDRLKAEREADPNYGGNNYEPEVQSIDGAPGWLVLASFAIGFLGIIFTAGTEPMIACAFAGQIFLVVGLAVIFSQKLTLDNYPILLFPLAGAAMIFFPLESLYRRKHGLGPLLTTDMIGILACSLFAVVGLCLMIMPYVRRHVMLKKCTVTVQATCIGLDSKFSSSGSGRHHRRTRVYAPDWEYTFNGKIYNHLEREYSNVGYPEIGSVHEIYVDPNDPVTIYRKSKTTIITTVMGALFVAVPVLVIYMMFFAK